VSTEETQATDSANKLSCLPLGFLCVRVFYTTLRFIDLVFIACFQSITEHREVLYVDSFILGNYAVVATDQ